MNRRSLYRTEVTITDPERGVEWEGVFGTRKLAVKSAFPVNADLPGLGIRQVYMLDLSQIAPEQRDRLITHVSRKFGLSESEVDRLIDELGVPILAEHCSMMTTVPIHLLLDDGLPSSDEDSIND